MRQRYRTVLGMTVALGLIAAFAVARDYHTGTVDLTRGRKADGGAWLGVYTQTIDKALMNKMDITVASGELVTDVVSESPAEKAGIEADDVITEVDGTKIAEDGDLTEVIGKHEPGDKVSITLVREGKQKQILVALGDREDSGEPVIITGRAHGRPWTFSGRNQHYGYIGVSLSELTRQLGTYFGVERGRGALISEVEEGSPAEAAGLRAGDVIVAIDDEKVGDVSDVREIIRDRKEGDKVSVSVIRDRKPLSVTVEVEEHSGWGSLDSYMGVLADAPMPPIPPTPEIRVWTRHNNAGDEYADRADFEADLAQMREELKGLSEQLSSDIVKKHDDITKDEMQQLKHEIEKVKREVSRLH